MKKYIQYNASQYLKQSTEAAGRSGSVVAELPSNGCNGEVLDLSGKPSQAQVAMVTRPKWEEDVEQDRALDLSKGNHLNNSDQNEALDLSKFGSSRASSVQSPNSNIKSPGSQSKHHGIQSPITSQPKATIGQYSLLQAALNSTPPASMMQGFEKLAHLEAELRARMIASGLMPADASRAIKPFSTVAPRPLGVSIPHLSMPSSSIAVVQGIHKPVAITTPQLNQSSISSKGHSISQGTVYSNSQSVNSHIPPSLSQSELMSNYQRHIQSESPKGVMGFHGGFVKRGENKQNQFVVRTADSTSHIIGGQNFMKVESMQGYACSQCPKVFKNKAALKLHTTVHKTTEERQYECQVCKRRFLHRHHLVVHQRKHSGEKPFKCDACSKTFMAIFLLHKHLRKHIRENSRNSLISTEQLQQLHIRKMTSDGPEGSLEVVGNVTNPVIIGGSPITLPDELCKSEMKDKSNAIKPVVKVEEEVISLLSDDLNSSTSTLSVSNSSVLSSFMEANKEVFNKTRTVDVATEETAEIKMDEKLDNHEVVVDAHNEYNVEIADTKPADEGKVTSSSSIDQEIQESAAAHVHDNVNSTESLAAIVGESSSHSEEIKNYFPEFAPDDEVILDFETGELKSVGKKANNWEEDLEDNAYSIFEENGLGMNLEKEEDIAEKKENPENSKKINGLEASKYSLSDEDNRYMRKHNLDGTEAEITEIRDSYIKTVQADKNNAASSIQPKQVYSKHDRENIELVDKEIDFEHDRKRKSEACLAEEPASKRQSFEIPQENDRQDFSSKDIVMQDPTKADSNHRKPVTKVKQKCSKKGRRAKCELCLRTFHSNHHLLLHMAVHKKNPMLLSLKKAKANQMKVLGYNGKSSVNCTICKKVFKFQKSLNSHMRVHSEKLKQNKLISKAFRDFMAEAAPPTQKSHPTSSETEYHYRNGSTEEKTVDSKQAEIVDAVCKNIESKPVFPVPIFKKNEEENEPPIEVIIGSDQIKRFVCHACNNTYTTKQKLKMHALIHKDNCFLCDICGKSFFRELTLEKHIATHLLPRPYVCNVCKKSFIHRSSLMRHKVVHEKPTMPSMKQQVADVNFELKMLDTYTMLQQERIQKLQMEKVKELKIEPEQSKTSVLDLSVRVKMDDASLPPVLSPAISQSSLPPQSISDLSPPIITHESKTPRPAEQYEHLKFVKEEIPGVSRDFGNEVDKIKQTEKRKRSMSSEVHQQPEPVSSEAGTFQKVARKTRVYETSCRVCREKFPNVMSLKTHMSVHNTVETHLYECHVCHHRFTQSCSLLRHLKTSCQENRMTCLPCGKTFHRRNTYDQHMKLHQEVPPRLDGSFFDKRKDEAEIKEEFERESDIENNNTKAAELNVEIPVKSEPLHILPVMKFVPSDIIANENTSDSTDSDARTYLYSEGEIHIAPMSDFSDSDLSPPQSPKPDISRSSLPSNSSPNTMTLNLLSAVCSDIRNAEKEEEERRKELEERQKELETIEILANLKRGSMQNSSEKNPKEEIKISASQVTQVTSENQNQVIDLSKDKHNTCIGDQAKVLNNLMLDCVLNERIKMESQKLELQTFIKQEGKDGVMPKFVSEFNKVPQTPTIPTVVLEVAAEAEHIRQEKVARIQQSQPIQLQPDKSNLPVVDERTQRILQELSRSNIHSSIIQERLSLLMKAQPSSLYSKPSHSSSGTSSVAMTSSPQISISTNTTNVCPMSVQNLKSETQTDPQDLSVKRIESQSGVFDLQPQDREPAAPPPLVPMFHCELCGKVMYNHNELLSHMRDHNISPDSFRKKPPFVAIGDPRQSIHKIKRSRPPDLPTSSASSSPFSDKTASDQVKVTTPRKVTPPLSLDLSSKASPGPSQLPSVLLPSMPSPLTGSDLSDAVSSPTTPQSGSLDNLRAELRNKIYARRRSQGLEELTVEFKPPEPTEMTEEEKRKLDHRRECNRQAAQRSRMRKKDLVDTLLEELHKEEIVNSDLRRKMECLTAEKSSLLKALETHTCVSEKLTHTDNG